MLSETHPRNEDLFFGHFEISTIWILFIFTGPKKKKGKIRFYILREQLCKSVMGILIRLQRCVLDKENKRLRVITFIWW